MKKYVALILMLCMVFAAVPVLAGGNPAKDAYNAFTYVPGPGWIVGYFGDWYFAGEAKYVYQNNMALRWDYNRAMAGYNAQSAYIASLKPNQYVDRAKLAAAGTSGQNAFMAANPKIAKPGGNETGWGLKHAFFKGGSGGPLRIATYGLCRDFFITKPGMLDPFNVFVAYNRPYVFDFAVMLAHGASFGFGAIPSSGGLETLVFASQGLNLLAWDAIIGSSADIAFGALCQFTPAKYAPGGVKFDYGKVSGYYYGK